MPRLYIYTLTIRIPSSQVLSNSDVRYLTNILLYTPPHPPYIRYRHSFELSNHNVEMVNATIGELAASDRPGACAALRVRGATAGHTRLHARLAVPSISGSTELLQTSVRLSVYGPLRVVCPPQPLSGPDRVVMTPGASVTVGIMGGPVQSGAADPSHSLSVRDRSRVTVGSVEVLESGQSPLYSFRVQCAASGTGTTDITLAVTPSQPAAAQVNSDGSITNAAADRNVRDTKVLRVVCDWPDSVRIAALDGSLARDIGQLTEGGWMLQQSWVDLVALGFKTSDTNSPIRFHALGSIQTQWTSSNPILLTALTSPPHGAALRNVYLDTETASHISVDIDTRVWQCAVTTPAIVVKSGTLSGSLPNAAASVQVSLQHGANPHTTVQIHVSKDDTVQSNLYSDILYSSALSPLRVGVSGGSHTNEVLCAPASCPLSHRRLRPANQTAENVTITAYDTALLDFAFRPATAVGTKPSMAATSRFAQTASRGSDLIDVEVSRVHSLQLTCPGGIATLPVHTVGKLALQATAYSGRSFTDLTADMDLYVRLEDETFPEDTFAASIDIQSNTARDISSLGSIARPASPDVLAVSLVGHQVARHALTVFTPETAHAPRVTSNECVVFVYEPYSLLPSRISLLPGTSYQLQVVGGPDIADGSSTQLRWVSSNTTAVTVDEQGEITTRAVGHATVSMTPFVQLRAGGDWVPFGEPVSSEVTVVFPKSLGILITTKHMTVGNLARAQVVGKAPALAAEALAIAGRDRVFVQWHIVSAGHRRPGLRVLQQTQVSSQGNNVAVWVEALRPGSHALIAEVQIAGKVAQTVRLADIIVSAANAMTLSAPLQSWPAATAGLAAATQIRPCTIKLLPGAIVSLGKVGPGQYSHRKPRITLHPVATGDAASQVDRLVSVEASTAQLRAKHAGGAVTVSVGDSEMQTMVAVVHIDVAVGIGFAYGYVPLHPTNVVDVPILLLDASAAVLTAQGAWTLLGQGLAVSIEHGKVIQVAASQPQCAVASLVASHSVVASGLVARIEGIGEDLNGNGQQCTGGVVVRLYQVHEDVLQGLLNVDSSGVDGGHGLNVAGLQSGLADETVIQVVWQDVLLADVQYNPQSDVAGAPGVEIPPAFVVPQHSTVCIGCIVGTDMMHVVPLQSSAVGSVLGSGRVPPAPWVVDQVVMTEAGAVDVLVGSQTRARVLPVAIASVGDASIRKESEVSGGPTIHILYFEPLSSTGDNFDDVGVTRVPLRCEAVDSNGQSLAASVVMLHGAEHRKPWACIIHSRPGIKASTVTVSFFVAETAAGTVCGEVGCHVMEERFLGAIRCPWNSQIGSHSPCDAHSDDGHDSSWFVDEAAAAEAQKHISRFRMQANVSTLILSLPRDEQGQPWPLRDVRYRAPAFISVISHGDRIVVSRNAPRSPAPGQPAPVEPLVAQLEVVTLEITAHFDQPDIHPSHQWEVQVESAHGQSTSFLVAMVVVVVFILFGLRHILRCGL